MKKIIALCCLLLFSLPAIAADWKEIFEKRYVDFETISYNQNQIKFWQKALRENPKDKFDNKDYWYTMSYYNLDCKNKTVRTEAIAVYDLKGKPLYSDSYISEWETIFPDTYMDAYYRIFCLVPFEENPLLH